MRDIETAAIRKLRLILAGAVLLCLCSVIAFAYDFPPLTGRVVDQANVIAAPSRTAIEAKLKDLEDKSGIQLVVATVTSLQDGDIETFANELFRSWKLGETKKNNGILLLVAPAEHKVRIEVGYGLEGTLTDALSSVIISTAIVPRFKANDISGGIERGVDGIISVLSGDTADWQPKKVDVRSDDPLGNGLFALLFVLVIIFIVWYFLGGAGGGTPGGIAGRGGRTIFLPTSGSSWSSSDWGGGSSGGGFSGGGGSSGGGGASGSW